MPTDGKTPASLPPPIPPERASSPTIELRRHPAPPLADGGIPWFEGSVTVPEVQRREHPPTPSTVPLPRLDEARLHDEGEIARGGMGSIRRLLDTQLLRRVAMKVLDPELAAHGDSLLRFLGEARITGQLDHPNIVPVHDLVVDDKGVPSYFTMKLVDGETLTQLIAAQKTQRDLEKLLLILLKVCDAVSFAHSRGVVHRDLKPDNIMVGSHGQVYVMDWGCARIVARDRPAAESRLDPEGTVIGTPNYMPPEQAWGHTDQIDARTDVFALGGILYKMLTGLPPYPGRFEEALPLAQSGRVRSPEESPGAAIKPPPRLSQIAMKALAADPAERYQTVEEMADELQAFLRGGNWFAMQKFPAGAVIVREGDRADVAYIITAGRCEVRQRNPDDPGRTAVLRTMGAGDVFGETAIFADAPRSASVIAIEDMTAIVIERRVLEELLRSSWLGVFVKALADRFLEHDLRLSRIGQTIDGPAK